MRRTVLSLLFALAACGDAHSGGDATAGDDTDASTTFTPLPDPSSTGGQPATGTADVSSDDGATFLDPYPDGSCSSPVHDGTQLPLSPCSTWSQDCCPGDKCMPWANGGGSTWNATRCSPVSEMPAQLGEPCSVEDSVASGIDTCDLGLMCWDVDTETLTGVCQAMCTGNPREPVCAADHSCLITNDGALNLCVFPCDPIAADCSAGQCVPADDGFVCVPTSDEVLPGEPCNSLGECLAGAACILEEGVPDCAGPYCCSNFCDLTAPDPALGCLPGQVCVSWYEAGNAPPEYEHVGVCGVEVPA